MKKISYFALAVISMTLFACGSKPADSDQQGKGEDYFEETHEDVLLYDEIDEAAPAETTETPVEAEEAPLEAAEAPATEVTEEVPASQETPAQEAQNPTVASDKFEIRGSDGNYIAFLSEVVTADANRCLPLNMVMDKKEESRVRLVIRVSKMDGTQIGLLPIGVEPGGTKINTEFCPPEGGVFDAIKAGERYQLSLMRAQLQ